MSMFWTAAALLGALAGLLVLLPLRRGGAGTAGADDARRAENLDAYRQQLGELEAARARGALDDAGFAAARLELDRRVLEDTAAPATVAAGTGSGRATLLGCAFAVPLLALGLYHHLGATPEIELAKLIAQLEQEMPEAQRAGLLARLQPRLEAQVRRADPDGDYRFLLARLYTAGERYPQAAALYAELVELYPEDAAIIAQSAQALYLAGGRKLTPAVQGLIDRAFAIDPAQVTLLGLVGMDRFQAGDYRGALDYWQKLLDHLPPGAPDAGVIREGIAMARARLGEDAEQAPPAVASDSGAGPATAGPRLQVAVSLAPGLELRPGDTVFVFARAVGGPPVPLAVARFPATELPREVELSDAMAMAPGMTLSSFPQVSVIARVSRRGGVNAQPGDLEGGGEPLTLSGGEQNVRILIDRTI
ncbi:MAG: c-type cytochrome biogenesis protein CcmI [Pseudomonadales bacterium]|jgi:cytochrome c-type biogenesis protein CcmH|nr:c-type cytochrome biogenesis protein CcmI [Pseudomonadales bacterium]